MSFLDECVKHLYITLTGIEPATNQTHVKIHSRYFERLGDLSFPLLWKNWLSVIKDKPAHDQETILNYKLKQTENDQAFSKIIDILKNLVKVEKIEIIDNHAHIFLDRFFVYKSNMKDLFNENRPHGKYELFNKHIELEIDENIEQNDINNLNLSLLRLYILKSVTANLLKLTTSEKVSGNATTIYLSLNRKNKNPHITCGPVINKNGVKDMEYLASDLFKRRAIDMEMVARHRYRVSANYNSDVVKYFYKLGVSSVTVELLSNKPHKPIKVSLKCLSDVNKGPSFIFYNCARLAVLLKEFDKNVEKGIYPKLPEIEDVDFSLLNQPEEWELFYGYILQFPNVVKNCIRDIEKEFLNVQNLITYLCNMCSVYSVYYRRIRILTNPREHLFSVLHSRIYLLKSLQYVFHKALEILNIDPIEEM
ncbi:DALR anticodon-binding domain-containing protein 3 [Sitophilus oryzae]|uniref:DALR anticodon-binding domain-containing protein 3 n=1 Tax=Sitophilus oryzae TaxID=7048 RepID=A0A6J2YFW3_SITOR|nr:DALR anticodon-binding domain-containing protein 3 [Sitophilus oryzae]